MKSCAGRLIVTQSGPESGYNVDWLYVSHKPAIFSDIVACLPKRIERQGLALVVVVIVVKDSSIGLRFGLKWRALLLPFVFAH